MYLQVYDLYITTNRFSFHNEIIAAIDTTTLNYKISEMHYLLGEIEGNDKRGGNKT